MVRKAALVLTLVCAGCDVPRPWTEADVRKVAREEAEDQVDNVARTVSHNASVGNKQDAKVEELERRIQVLESERLEHRAEIANLEARLATR